MSPAEWSYFYFNTEENGRIVENKGAHRYKDGKLVVKLLSAIYLDTKMVCKPCSDEKFVKYLNGNK